ncbi:hypothetical protein [Bradyrhizobium neotropicale]|uniref:hypothetical protein n=1 Tax=Bradyrhizobium neotropicale TaxID=1497615 RepID=UPI0011AB424E|nr:hypothetical protein [Bradyrhizobium neotropicale]
MRDLDQPKTATFHFAILPAAVAADRCPVVFFRRQTSGASHFSATSLPDVASTQYFRDNVRFGLVSSPDHDVSQMTAQ